MINYSPYEKEWFRNEWRSACFIVRKGAKKKGVDLSKIGLVAIPTTYNKKGDEEG